MTESITLTKDQGGKIIHLPRSVYIILFLFWGTAMANQKEFICAFFIFIAHLKYSAAVLDFADRVTRDQDHSSRIKSLCQIERFFFMDFPSWPCSGLDPHCTANVRRYFCMNIFVKAFDAHTREVIVDKANLFLSEQEYEAYEKYYFTDTQKTISNNANRFLSERESEANAKDDISEDNDALTQAVTEGYEYIQEPILEPVSQFFLKRSWKLGRYLKMKQ